MEHIRCCRCGTELLCCDSDARAKLSLCVGCWLRLSSMEIVSQSRLHDGARGHGHWCRGLVAWQPFPYRRA